MSRFQASAVVAQAEEISSDSQKESGISRKRALPTPTPVSVRKRKVGIDFEPGLFQRAVIGKEGVSYPARITRRHDTEIYVGLRDSGPSAI